MTDRTDGAARFAPLSEYATTDPDRFERDVLARWREADVFATVQEARADAPAYVFWEGPPTANGRPGIHHVLARSIKDAVCRYRTMCGERVERKAGWDTQGLPVELEVEKSLGISGKPEIEEYGVAAFNARCRESVWTYKKEWEELSERLGYWLDYERPYVTYEKDYIESVWFLLAKLHAHGLVYRGKRVLPYCPRCGTSLSAHELGQPGVYREIVDPSVTVRFTTGEAVDGEPVAFLAWTTTPWTLPSNFALCVHPGREYVLARSPRPVAKGAESGSKGYERVWVVAERADAVLPEGWTELERRPGSELVGTRYEAPFDAVASRLDPGAWTPDESAIHQVLPGDFVTVDDGTGIVHQAPYGADDWQTAQAHRLPLPLAVGSTGEFVEDVGPAAKGTFFKQADDALMDDLKRRGKLFSKAREPHSYPHCWRCRTPLVYFPTPAWFVQTTAFKQRMIEHNRAVNWVPAEIGQGRFGDWLENNVDWNISRDRFWGTPLPYWVCAGCDRERAVASFAELFELAGGLPDDFDPHKPIVDELELACSDCGAAMRRTGPVLDCWFDSGSMPYAQHHWPFAPDANERLQDQFPADLIAEGLDQTRGWFYSLHAIGCFATTLGADDLPAGVEPLASETGAVYRNCLVGGLVLDKDGVKMSKSLGNVVDPWEAIERHGIDAVRWYLLGTGSLGLDKRFDHDGVVDIRRRVFGTLLNSYKFFAEYARIDGFDPESAAIPPVGDRPEIDRWLVSRTQTTLGNVREAFERYDLSRACQSLERFLVGELSNWYIRRNRRRFWKGETGADKLAAYATLFEALSVATRSIAPIAPFTAEALWARLTGAAATVHAEILPEPSRELVDEDLESSMWIVERLVEMGRALRERAGQRIRQPLRALHVRTSDERAQALLTQAFATEQILDELNVKEWGSLAADDGELCRLVAKPNFRVLGKKVGKDMKRVAAAIAALGQEDVAKLRAGSPVGLSCEPYPRLAPEDVQITVETTAEFDVEADGRFVVWLDTELDDELVLEGLAREVVNRVNGLRKERGLAVDDRIHLWVAGRGDALERALEAHGDLIAAETLATVVERSDEAFDDAASGAWELGDGLRLAANLRSA